MEDEGQAALKKKKKKKKKKIGSPSDRRVTETMDWMWVPPNVRVRTSWYLAPNSWIVAQKRDALSAGAGTAKGAAILHWGPQVAAGEWEAC